MEKKYEKYLPVGTVVLLKEGEKKVMITGFCTSGKDNLDKIFDYSGCLYPEGIISSDTTLLFNHNQIDKIYFVGYRDQEEVEFKKKLDAVMNEMNNQN